MVGLNRKRGRAIGGHASGWERSSRRIKKGTETAGSERQNSVWIVRSTGRVNGRREGFTDYTIDGLGDVHYGNWLVRSVALYCARADVLGRVRDQKYRYRRLGTCGSVTDRNRNATATRAEQ